MSGPIGRASRSGRSSKNKASEGRSETRLAPDNAKSTRDRRKLARKKSVVHTCQG